jgi:catechol 2,3-dioxygenase
MTPTALPDETQVALVHLRTANLAQSIPFYSDVLGLKRLEHEGPQASFAATSTGPALVVLTEDPGATVNPGATNGLFHFALRYPTRGDLARALLRLTNRNYPLEGASDHLVSEALYLRDGDQNGIELYADRPRSQWVWRDGQVVMATEALDLDNLLSSISGKPDLSGPPPGTDLGHIHLHVADLLQADGFYHNFLGLAVTQRSYPGALFFSAGGYHHHVAANVWGSKRPAPANSVGLISYRLEAPTKEVLSQLEQRAPRAGYQTRRESGATGGDLLRIGDPNGHWLEIQSRS